MGLKDAIRGFVFKISIPLLPKPKTEASVRKRKQKRSKR